MIKFANSTMFMILDCKMMDITVKYKYTWSSLALRRIGRTPSMNTAAAKNPNKAPEILKSHEWLQKEVNPHFQEMKFSTSSWYHLLEVRKVSVQNPAKKYMRHWNNVPLVQFFNPFFHILKFLPTITSGMGIAGMEAAVKPMARKVKKTYDETNCLNFTMIIWQNTDVTRPP